MNKFASKVKSFGKNIVERHRNACAAVVTGVSVCQGMVLQMYAADDIFEKGKKMLNRIYSDIVGITCVTAGCIAAVCLYLMMFSKNQRTVEGSISWLKRIAVCAVAILLMSSILKFIVNHLDLSTDQSGININ